MIAFSIFALLLRLLGTLGGASHRPAPPAPTPPAPTSPDPMPADPAPTEMRRRDDGSYDGPHDGPGHGAHDRPDGHPESLTAVLDPDAEEYLAWLAYHHWPADEYLELEQVWELDLDRRPERRRQAERDRQAGFEPFEPFEPFESFEPAPIRSTCPQCLRHSDDVWPCWTCGRLLHSACGHGLRRRRVRRPYRTRDMSAEAVTAEWICTDCSCVVGLDVERNDGGPGGDAGN